MLTSRQAFELYYGFPPDDRLDLWTAWSSAINWERSEVRATLKRYDERYKTMITQRIFKTIGRRK